MTKINNSSKLCYICHNIAVQRVDGRTFCKDCYWQYETNKDRDRKVFVIPVLLFTGVLAITSIIDIFNT